MLNGILMLQKEIGLNQPSEGQQIQEQGSSESSREGPIPPPSTRRQCDSGEGMDECQPGTLLLKFS